jgi:hypothetical protein
MGGRRLTDSVGSRAAWSSDSPSRPRRDWTWQSSSASKSQPAKEPWEQNRSDRRRSPRAAFARRASTTRSRFTCATHAERATARTAASGWTTAPGSAPTAWRERDALRSQPPLLRPRSQRSRPPQARPRHGHTEGGLGKRSKQSLRTQRQLQRPARYSTEQYTPQLQGRPTSHVREHGSGYATS